MAWLAILGKVTGSVILLAFLGVGIIRASPRYTSPKVSRKIDALIGAIFFIVGLLGLYLLWLH